MTFVQSSQFLVVSNSHSLLRSGYQLCCIGIIHTEKLITQSLRVAYEGRWSFCKVFGDGSFLASGYVHLLPGGRKSPKTVKDNTYVLLLSNLSLHLANSCLARFFMLSKVLLMSRYMIQLISFLRVVLSWSLGVRHHLSSSLGKISNSYNSRKCLFY